METFSALLAICVGNSPVNGEFPTQRPVTRSFGVSFICIWINSWVNNGEAGDLSCNRAHYGVIVMKIADILQIIFWNAFSWMKITIYWFKFHSNCPKGSINDIVIIGSTNGFAAGNAPFPDEPQLRPLTHLPLDKMTAISQTTFSNAFSWMQLYEFRLRFHWSLFLRIKLTIFQH